MKNVSSRDNCVELLRIIACFIVIGTHVKLNDLPSALPSHTIDVARTFIGGFFGEGVTIFFIIMGFFVLNNTSFTKLKKAFKSILVPALLYIIISNVLLGWITGHERFIDCITNPKLDIINIIKNILTWNSTGIALSPHLWYIFTYCQILLWVPLLSLLIQKDKKVQNIRRFVMILCAVYVVINNLQKVVQLPFAISCYTVITIPVFEVLIGYEIYMHKDKIKGNKLVGLVALISYFGIHILSSYLQCQYYLRDINNGHELSWNSSIAIIGAVGLTVFILSLDIKRNYTKAIINRIGSYTLYIYLIHWSVLIRLNSMKVQESILKMNSNSFWGELLYTLEYSLLIFVISLVIAFLIGKIVDGIKKCKRAVIGKNIIA